MRYEYEYRNFKYNRHGGIDAEVEHPEFGWIPYTLYYDEEQEVKGSAAFSVAPADPIPAHEVMQMIDRRIKELLDLKAIEMDYSDYMSCISYTDDPNPKFAAEAKSMKEWRSAIYTEVDRMRQNLSPEQISAYNISRLAEDLPAFEPPII